MADVKIDQNELKQMQETMAEMQTTIDNLNERVKKAEDRIPDMGSTIAIIDEKNAKAEREPKIVKLLKHNGYRIINKDTGEKEQIPFEGKENCCPFCTMKKENSLLDLTKSGRWACRNCGKHWYEEALGQPYSKKLEKFIRVGDADAEFMDKYGGSAGKTADDKVAALEKQVSELKDLLLRLSLPQNGTKEVKEVKVA